jgi:hypothetical protein
MNTQTAYPLSWPSHWVRQPRRHRSAFSARSVDQATRALLNQLRISGVGEYNVVISTNLQLRNDGLPRSNQAEPTDTAAAVYFRFKDKPRVLACDRWDRVADNLWAMAKHIETLRAQERWGVGTMEQAFAGYTALPAPGDSGAATWWAVLGVAHDCTLETALAAYREQARRCHPDANGGTHEAMTRLNAAWDQARKSFPAVQVST